MSKVTFRPKLLDSVRQMPVYVAEVLPDLPEFSAVNRGVPQMPSGMEKEEESEHHLLKAICSGQIIPTPDFVHMNEEEYSQLYPKTYKKPKQLIRLQLAFLLDSDEPEYNADSEDEKWLISQANKINIDQRKFESIMDKLEKSNYQTVISLNEAKAFIKDDDDIVIAIYDYWLNKRLLKQHSLICSVKTDVKPGISANSPYIAFRKRVEKMQTRKNRKNDEVSYERMLKFQRDLLKALYIIELVQKRERLKKEKLKVSSKLFELRFAMKDFNGEAIHEAIRLHQRNTAVTTGSSMNLYSSSGSGRSVFSTLYDQNDNSWSDRILAIKEEISSSISSTNASNRRSNSSAAYASSFSGSSLGDKRQYKRRKIKNSFTKYTDDDSIFLNNKNNNYSVLSESEDDEYPFLFKRNKYSFYYKPINVTEKHVDEKQKYSLTSISFPNKYFGFGRRRVGRGGRVVLDRATNSIDDIFQLFDDGIIELNNNHRTEMSSMTSQSDASKVKSETQPTSVTVVSTPDTGLVPVSYSSEESQSQSQSPFEIMPTQQSISSVFVDASTSTVPVATTATVVVAANSTLTDTSPKNQNDDCNRFSNCSTSSCIPNSLFQKIIDTPKFNIDHFTEDLLLNTQNELEQIENWPCFRPKTPPPQPSKISTQSKQDSQITRTLWSGESTGIWTSNTQRLSSASMSANAITADDLQITVQIENCDRNEKSIFKNASSPIDSNNDFSNMLSSDDTGRKTVTAKTTTKTPMTTMQSFESPSSQSSTMTTVKLSTNKQRSDPTTDLSSSINAVPLNSIRRTSSVSGTTATMNTSSNCLGQLVIPSNTLSKRNSNGNVSNRDVQPKQHFLLQQQLQAGPLMSSALKAFTLTHNYNCVIPVNAITATFPSSSQSSTPSKSISSVNAAPLSCPDSGVISTSGHANRSPTVMSSQIVVGTPVVAAQSALAPQQQSTQGNVLAQQSISQTSPTPSTAAPPPPTPPPPYVAYTTNDHSTYFNHKQMPTHIINGGGTAVPYTEPKYLNSGVFIK